MGIRSSLRRAPLSGTRLDHVRVVDVGARADYLLRAWPDPRLFRRSWSHDEWFEFEPPWLDVSAWARDEVVWTVQRVPRSRRRVRRAPTQCALPLDDPGPRVLAGGFDDFIQSIPSRVTNAIAGFRHGQYRLLRLLAAHPRACDLIEANPALTVCLTDLDAFCGKRVYEKQRHIDNLLAMRQREALQWLGFSGTDSTRKILRKLRQESISVYLLLQLRTALADTTATTLLRHCPSIHRGSLALVADPDCRPRITPSLLQEVATRDEELLRPHTAPLVREIASLQRLLGFDGTPLRASSVRDTRRLHDELTEQYLRLGIRHQREREERERQRRAEEEATRAEQEVQRRAEEAARQMEPLVRRRPTTRKSKVASTVRFPDPPIEGPAPDSPLRADPIRTRAELVEWAERQHNCCASPRYVRRLREGSLAVYRLRLGQDEATLSLVHTRGRWMREDCKAPRNRAPSKEMRFVVGRWLQQRGVWVPSGWLD